MVLTALHADYKPFVVVITQTDKESSFTEFKVALRNFEDTEKARDENEESVVVRTISRQTHQMKSAARRMNSRPGNIKCYACGQHGHKADSCTGKINAKLW